MSILGYFDAYCPVRRQSNSYVDPNKPQVGYRFAVGLFELNHRITGGPHCLLSGCLWFKTIAKVIIKMLNDAVLSAV